MKYIKWKSLAITSTVCLLPILLGVFLWGRIPGAIAIHFNINNEPDNFASKEFGVFGLPILMMLVQIFCCFINDINAHRHGENVKFERVTRWIIPVMTFILQTTILGYSVGWNVDIRKVAIIIVSSTLLVIGNYLPKLDYIKNYNIDTEKARKINRFMGKESIIMGILMLVTIFLPPIATVICLFLFIPYILIGVIYGVRIGRKKDN